MDANTLDATTPRKRVQISDQSFLRNIDDAKKLLARMESLFSMATQLGWDHEVSEYNLCTTFEAFVSLSARSQGQTLKWDVLPCALALGDTVVWEPDAPFDTIPRNLFGSGIRALHFPFGMQLEEFLALLKWMLSDPETEIAPGSDLVSTLWDLQLPNVHALTVDPFVEGDAAEREAFLTEVQALEAWASDACEQAGHWQVRAPWDRDALGEKTVGVGNGPF